MKYLILASLFVSSVASAETVLNGCDIGTHQTAMAYLYALQDACKSGEITDRKIADIKMITSQECNTPVPVLYDQSKLADAKKLISESARFKTDATSCQKAMDEIFPVSAMIEIQTAFAQMPVDQQRSRQACAAHTSHMQFVYEYYKKAYTGQLSLTNAEAMIESQSDGYAEGVAMEGILPTTYINILGMRANMKNLAFSGKNSDEQKERLRYGTYQKCVTATLLNIAKIQQQNRPYNYSQQ